MLLLAPPHIAEPAPRSGCWNWRLTGGIWSGIILVPIPGGIRSGIFCGPSATKFHDPGSRSRRTRRDIAPPFESLTQSAQALCSSPQTKKHPSGCVFVIAEREGFESLRFHPERHKCLSNRAQEVSEVTRIHHFVGNPWATTVITNREQYRKVMFAVVSTIGAFCVERRRGGYRPHVVQILLTYPYKNLRCFFIRCITSSETKQQTFPQKRGLGQELRH